ncbi:centromere identifier [Drosophila ananassae]|uniref:Centromere identifier n=1 Tax=Drosophila ananassae TaxID=7217 RepID=B3MGZ1_DROAN|nr:histone H3-like centromeric protein cid [Drosophila ananassae]EDV37909.1 centromere identifier [Drosophila ananassae]
MRPPPKRGERKRAAAPQPSREDTDSEHSDDESAFRSPDNDDATDYGLEFTTSRLNLQDVSNRRCSTLRKDTSATRKRLAANQSTSEEEEEDEENQSPSTRSRTSLRGIAPQSSQVSSAAESPQRRAGPQTPQRRSAAPQPPQGRPTAQPLQRSAQTAGAGRRKGRRPLNREARMQREIRNLQMFTGNLIPRLPFSRLVRELLYSEGAHQPFKITAGALEALQSSSEIYMTQRLQDAYYLTLHRGRVTLDVRDMVLMGYICDNLRRN